jgi:hypothetical protein
MSPRRYRPIPELESHLDRGELDFAIALAKDIVREHKRPLGLDLALEFLPLVAAQNPGSYDDWACRWLNRWLSETRGATIDTAAEIAGALAKLPVKPRESLEAIQHRHGSESRQQTRRPLHL